ncbi:uncharacterized protein PFLUO_LOCUS2092 [Penicillium psychrofluorescens]|uniref:uncharacterized protein n=1 Tax=Penicillium psychrofluorescens TaxID=3158075 RepID=UPI003CCE42AF
MTYLQDVYQQFLARPQSAPLAADISLIYVTSTTQFDRPDAVITHLSRQASIAKKKSENVLSVVEGTHSLCLDIETKVQFLEGGGAWLSSIDDNFIIDRVVTFPTVHIVNFNSENEIQQVRIYWDQASLLKQAEVIGSSGRNWPIRDAKDQIRYIKAAEAAKSAAPPSQRGETSDLPHRPASPQKRHIKDPYAADSLFDLLSPSKADAAREQQNTSAPAPSSRPASAQRDAPEAARPSSPNKRITRDPYAQESLYDMLSPNKEAESREPMRPYAPSAARPAARQYGELFVGDDEQVYPDSPTRSAAPKAGAGRSNPNRIWGDEDVMADERNPGENRSMYKSDPRKYGHFDIGGEAVENQSKATSRSGKSRHQSQWDFSDFTAPEKSTTRAPYSQEVRNFGWSDQDEGTEAPPRKPAVPQPRPDANVHFEMTDDNGEDDSGRVISAYQNRGQKLYENRLWDENGEAAPTEREIARQQPLSNVANTQSRRKDFGPHYEMTDDSPPPSTTGNSENYPVPEDRQKAVKMMEANWESYDVSPQPSKPAYSRNNHDLRNNHNQPSWSMSGE